MVGNKPTNQIKTQEAICYAREIPVWGEDGEETDEEKCLPKEGKALLLSQVRLCLCVCVWRGWTMCVC